MSTKTTTDIIPIVTTAHAKNQTVVLATGVFDLLHQEHRRFLRRAKAAGDLLIVGLETDARVTAIKGQGRPVNPLATRIKALEKWNLADHIFALPQKFDHQTHWEKFIKDLRPDIYAVSSHTSWLDNKRALVEKYGGQLQIVHQHNPKISSSKLLKANQE